MMEVIKFFPIVSYLELSMECCKCQYCSKVDFKHSLDHRLEWNIMDPWINYGTSCDEIGYDC